MGRKIMQNIQEYGKMNTQRCLFFFSKMGILCAWCEFCVHCFEISLCWCQKENVTNLKYSCAPSLGGMRAGFLPRITHSAPRQILSNFGNVWRASKLCVLLPFGQLHSRDNKDWAFTFFSLNEASDIDLVTLWLPNVSFHLSHDLVFGPSTKERNVWCGQGKRMDVFRFSFPKYGEFWPWSLSSFTHWVPVRELK